MICNGRHIPYDQDLKELSQQLRNNATPQEKKLWYQFLKFQKLHFYRQKPLDGYIVDFYCPKLKLVIEIDGVQHLEEGSVEYDNERTLVLANYGLQVIRFTNYQIDFEFDSVCTKITRFLQYPL
ncbi:MAG: endonuclease domain-containing protein [Patescibacteria group bacterium]|nr:endonuclease domain-containing protein [Patescibacteria group bacterium]